MKKRLISLLLVVCMVLSLAACKKSGKDDGTTKEASTITGESFATYDYFNKLMGRTENVSGSTLYKYADFITLGEYKGVDAKVDFSIKVVKDEDFESSLKSILEKYGETNQITSGTTKDGDKINLDFSGLLDGVAFDNGTATDYTYTIGGSFIEDLDRGLIGLTVGKEYSIPCKFPDDYSTDASLAGKDVVFNVKVNYIEETIIPELTDELAKKIAEDNSLTDEFATVEGLKTYLKKSLEDSALASFKEAKFNAAWENVLANCKFDGKPQVDYDSAYNSMVANAKNTYASYESLGIEWESFLKMYSFESQEDFEKYCADSALNYVQTKLAMMAIADKEGLTVSEEEYKECSQYYVDYYKYDNLDALLADLGESKDAFIEERYYEVIYEKVYNIVLDSCKEIDTPSETEKTE